jgi:hypothetical protein
MNKAYIARDKTGYRENCVVVFAETAGKAKQKAHIELETDSFIDVELKRAKQYDTYSSMEEISKEVLIQDGWWFECRCGYQITQDRINEGEAAVFENEVYCQTCNPFKV